MESSDNITTASEAVEQVFGGPQEESGPKRIYEDYRGRPLCGTSEEEVAAQRRAIDEDDERLRQETREREIVRLVGHRFCQASFAAYQDTQANSRARQAAERWLSLRDCNLIISGSVGAGKTWLMACLCRVLIEEGCWMYDGVYESFRYNAGKQRERGVFKNVSWLSAPGWVAALKRGFQSKEAAADAALDLRYGTDADLLFLDDLGKVHPGQNGASWLEEQFYSLIDLRYREGLATVVTTEWNREALGERVGTSVVSRLMDGALVAPLDAYEWRKLAAGSEVAGDKS